jgi:hypothetical protein
LGSPTTVAVESPTDATGAVAFSLPPGDYWVVVPWADALPGWTGANVGGQRLPDGRLVFGYALVGLPAAATVDVRIAIAVAAS